MPNSQELLRSLPSVSSLLEQAVAREWLKRHSKNVVVASIQEAVDDVRQSVLAGQVTRAIGHSEIVEKAGRLLERRCVPALRPVINATGIVLHTGLGRAPLSSAAIEALAAGACGYCNLELDLESGQRGRRASHVAEKLAACTGAEAATVVNNNAAATLLILQTLAAGRETIVSRGQLVEIGGSFRLPDVMAASGSILREVGTTNRTRLSDYERAIGANTALILRVHPSNYRIIGFTKEVDAASLSDLAHRHRLIFVDDLGSGALVDLTTLGLPAEPLAKDSLKASADLVCFSGDKLLGGPQSGIIVGRRDLIDRLEANPLMRTYRVDKLVLLALEATLFAYIDGDPALSIPTLAMLSEQESSLLERARVLAERLGSACPEEQFFVGSDTGFAGGGALPAREIPTVVVQWRPARMTTEAVIAALRRGHPPIISRIRDDAVCFDLRTIRVSDLEPLVQGVASTLRFAGSAKV